MSLKTTLVAIKSPFIKPLSLNLRQRRFRKCVNMCSQSVLKCAPKFFLYINIRSKTLSEHFLCNRTYSEHISVHIKITGIFFFFFNQSVPNLFPMCAESLQYIHHMLNSIKFLLKKHYYKTIS